MSTTAPLFVLGAVDPEMRAIEKLLTQVGAPWLCASVEGKRVYAANAYQAGLPDAARTQLAQGGTVYLVECIGQAPAGCRRIDHHHPGDPGYGRPPAEYWPASSLGQTVAALAASIAPDLGPTPQWRLIAAADHCLGAAYGGLCPGVTPATLLQWQVAARARFTRRSTKAVLEEIERTRARLRMAPRVELAAGQTAADLRDQTVPELPLAAAREGRCCLSTVVARDGRTKVGCLIGSPRQIESFMQVWAPARGLVDIYGDPIRGFAGAYRPSAPA